MSHFVHDIFTSVGVRILSFNAQQVRRIRSLQAERVAVTAERKRWWPRARSHLRAAGVTAPRGATKITRMLDDALARPDGLPTTTAAALDLCARQQRQLGLELEAIAEALHRDAEDSE